MHGENLKLTVIPSSKFLATIFIRFLPYISLYNESPLYSMEDTGLIDWKNCMEILEN